MAIRLGFLIKNLFVKIIILVFRSFIGIPIQILIIFLAFPHTELGVPVSQLVRVCSLKLVASVAK